jgi:hypothetical protein
VIVAAFVLNFTASATPRKTGLARQARDLLRVGLWGVPLKAQLNPVADDRVIAYVGAPERLFVGDAVVEIETHPWSDSEAARFPAYLDFGRGLALAAAQIWPLSVSLMDVWPNTHGSESNPAAHWRGGMVALSDEDADVIIARGRRKPLPPGA